MRNIALVDAGPLIALFDRNDSYHDRAVSFVRKYRGSLITNISVITEVSHLLDFDVRVQLDFLRWLSRGAIEIEVVDEDDLSSIVPLVEKYADLPKDFADASLVVQAERLGIQQVVSVDKDFCIYRLSGRRKFKNIFL